MVPLSVSEGASGDEGQQALQVLVVETELEADEVIATVVAEDVVDTTEQPELSDELNKVGIRLKYQSSNPEKSKRQSKCILA